MPPRSVKMKRRIFGFQRRVWWPKWTPASSNSRIETTDIGIRSPFWLVVIAPAEPGWNRHPSNAGTATQANPPGRVGKTAAFYRLDTGAGALQGRSEIVRQPRLHLHALPTEGVAEAETGRVPELSRQTDLLRAPV